MRKMRTIAAVNGESDVPGWNAWNAAIRGVMRAATHAHGMRVIGIRSGFDGLEDGA